MSFDLIKANLNLYAVLKNLEDLVKYDEEIHKAAKAWSLSIQFSVRGGPKAFVRFQDGQCEVRRGKLNRSSTKLFFASPRHLNNMFDGKANPILLKGFTQLRSLFKDFPKATNKLAYYLKPTEERLKSPAYMELNTRFSLTTAAFALKELFQYDPIGQLNASHICDGTVLLKVVPDGPSVHLVCRDGAISAHKGGTNNPTAAMMFRDTEAANRLLHGKDDAFSATVNGDVSIKGHLPTLETINIVLDRIPLYLS